MQVFSVNKRKLNYNPKLNMVEKGVWKDGIVQKIILVESSETFGSEQGLLPEAKFRRN